MSDSQTCYKCDPPAEVGPGQIEDHNRNVHGGGKHLVPHPRVELETTQDLTAKAEKLRQMRCPDGIEGCLTDHGTNGRPL